MNILSLFDGISCGRLALERADIDVENYFASEIDTNAIAISKYNWHSIVHLGDIQKLDFKNLPKIDLILAGTPCQGFSCQGDRKGLEDWRSKLFFDFIAILDEIQPDYFLMENVKMSEENNKIVTSYVGVEPVLINSALVSGQQRNRLYWSNIEICQPDNLGIDVRDILTSGEVFPETSIRFKGKLKSMCIRCTVPSINYTIACRRRDHTMVMESDYTFRHLNPIERERLQTLPDNYTLGCKKEEEIYGLGMNMTNRLRATGNCWTVDVIKHILEGII